MTTEVRTLKDKKRALQLMYQLGDKCTAVL